MGPVSVEAFRKGLENKRQKDPAVRLCMSRCSIELIYTWQSLFSFLCIPFTKTESFSKTELTSHSAGGALLCVYQDFLCFNKVLNLPLAVSVCEVRQ